jgi:two-component system, cell cycle response regulator
MSASTAPCKVLVIDPCPETQAFITSQAEGRGFSIISASDPSSAREAIDHAAPDIVITDLFYPEGAGLALANAIKTSHEQCPVILMGTTVPDLKVMQAFRAGAVDYLRKPVAEDELAYALHRAVLQLEKDGTNIPGVSRLDYSVTMDSDPAHVPGVISWLMKTSASRVSESRQLQLRGALTELLFNAVEHGNLKISGRDKQQAIAEDRYERLLEERLAQSCLKDRKIRIHVTSDADAKSLSYRIVDEGKGFEWRALLNQSSATCRTEDACGRGIFLTRSFFPDLVYNEQGNEVTIRLSL